MNGTGDDRPTALRTDDEPEADTDGANDDVGGDDGGMLVGEEVASNVGTIATAVVEEPEARRKLEDGVLVPEGS